MEKIIEEIKAERAAQDAQWGGPEHDDEHDMNDFSKYILRQLNLCYWGRGPGVRERFLKIAALAVAAVESHDRTLRDYGGDA